MNNTIRTGLIILVIFLGIRLGLSLLSGLMYLLAPIGMLAGIVLIIYGIVANKSLGGGNRKNLP